MDHIRKNLIIDPVKILNTETTTIRTNQEIIFSHYIAITLIFHIHQVKTIEIAHSNIKAKLIKYNLQMKQT